MGDPRGITVSPWATNGPEPETFGRPVGNQGAKAIPTGITMDDLRETHETGGYTHGKPTRDPYKTYG